MAELTHARRAVAAALLFLLAAVLAGVTPGEAGTSYRLFWLPEGLLGVLLTFALLDGRGWTRPAGMLGWLPVGYGTLANAQILALLLPPPGIVNWFAVVGVMFVLLAALALTAPRRMMALLAGMGVLLALIKFSVIPFLWARSGPGPGEALGLGSGLERLRRLVVEHEPVSQEGQLLGLIAVCLWVVATRLLWSDPLVHEPADHHPALPHNPAPALPP